MAWEPVEQILFDAALFAGGDKVALLMRRHPDVLISAFFEDADRLGMSHDGLYGYRRPAGAPGSTANHPPRVQLSRGLHLRRMAGQCLRPEVAGRTAVNGFERALTYRSPVPADQSMS